MKDILNDINSECHKIYDNNYYSITFDEFKSIVDYTITINKVTFMDKYKEKFYTKKILDSFKQTIIHDVEEKLKELHNKKLKTKESTNEAIEYIIKTSLNSALDLSLRKKYFSRFCKLLDEINMSDLNNIIYFINEYHNVEKTVSLIYEKYSKIIASDNLDSLLSTDTEKRFIKTYCTMNDINISDSILTDTDIDITDYTRAYIKQIQQYPLLSAEDEKYLARRVKLGDKEDKDKFIGSNLRLVVFDAKFYVGRGLSYDDLIQLGNIGLMKAVDKYEPDKGYRFSTYAHYWIKEEISRGIANTGRMIRIPEATLNLYYKYIRIYDNLKSQLGREPNPEELAKVFKQDINFVKRFLLFYNDVDSYNTKSTIHDEEHEKIDFVESEYIGKEKYNLENKVVDSFLHDDLKEVWDNTYLSEKERTAIIMSLGLEDGVQCTFRDIAKKLDLTIEGARQCCIRGYKKLRRNCTSKNMKEYLKKGY